MRTRIALISNMSLTPCNRIAAWRSDLHARVDRVVHAVASKLLAANNFTLNVPIGASNRFIINLFSTYEGIADGHGQATQCRRDELDQPASARFAKSSVRRVVKLEGFKLTC